MIPSPDSPVPAWCCCDARAASGPIVVHRPTAMVGSPHAARFGYRVDRGCPVRHPARFERDRHAVGCASRTHSGRVHAGVLLKCNVGRIAVCAEAVAIGRAATDGDGHDIETIVAVYCAAAGVEPVVAAPCGMCREMISDCAPAARVIMPSANGPRVVRVSRLLPGKFARPDAPTPYPDVGAVHGSDGL